MSTRQITRETVADGRRRPYTRLLRGDSQVIICRTCRQHRTAGTWWDVGTLLSETLPTDLGAHDCQDGRAHRWSPQDEEDFAS